LLLGSPAQADRASNPLRDRFQVTLGSFFLTSRPIVQLDGVIESGDRVHWDREFGRMDGSRIRVEGQWRSQIGTRLAQSLLICRANAPKS
jgi:hypothetical protein